jgi:hypothetical protein
MGRGIRRLISLFDSLEAIINEADNRLQAEADARAAQEPTTDEDIEVYETYVVDGHIHALTTQVEFISSEHTYRAYTLLLQLVPRVKEMLEDSGVDTDTFNHFIAQVQSFQASA